MSEKESAADSNFMSNLNCTYQYLKSNLEAERDEVFDELLQDLRKGLRIFREEKLSEPQLLQVFINDHLPVYVQLMLDRKYVRSSELIIQIKTNEFFQECLEVCSKNLHRKFPGLFEIIRRIFNTKSSFYSIYSYYDYDFKKTVLTNMETYNRSKWSLEHPQSQRPIVKQPEPLAQSHSQQTQSGFHVSKDSEDALITINLESPEMKIQEIGKQRKVSEAEEKLEKSESEKWDKESEDQAIDPKLEKVPESANPPENIPKDTETEIPPIERSPDNEPDFTVEYEPRSTSLKREIFASTAISPFYVLNLVHFEKLQALECLLNLLHVSRSAAQMLAILEFTEPLWNVFDREFLLGRFRSVLQDIRLIPQKISEDEIKNSRKTEISELLRTLEFVFEKFYAEPEIKDLLDVMELELYLMCFKSQYLEKRIFGLSSIISKIRESKYSRRIQSNSANEYRILVNNTSVGNNGNNDGSPSKSSNNSSKNLLNWIEKEGIFEIIFGESMHLELVNRSVPLLSFLYENGRLSNRNLDLIFELAHGKHEAFRNPASKILIELIEKMNVRDMKSILDKLRAIPPNETTAEILSILKTVATLNRFPDKFSQKEKDNQKDFEMKEMTGKHDFLDDDDQFFTPFTEEIKREENIKEIGLNNELKPLIVSHNEKPSKNEENSQGQGSNTEKATEEFENEVLEHLWTIMIASSQCPISIGFEALKTLSEVLARSLSPKKLEFIQKSIEKVSSNTNIHESLQILESIIKGSYPIRAQEGDRVIRNRVEMVEYLEKEFAVTNEIMASIITLKKSFVNFVISQGQGHSANTFNQVDFPDPDKFVSEDFATEERKNPKIAQKNAALGSATRKKSFRPEEEKEKLAFQSEEEKSSGVLNNIANANDAEVKSIDLTQPTRGDKETLSISTDASSFDDLNALFEKNNRPLFDNALSNNKPIDELGLYLKEIDCRLKFLRGLFEISLELLDVKHIKILWEVLVINSLNEQEKDFFFNLFHSVVYSAKDKYVHLKEDVIYYIYFDILLKLDQESYNLKAFFCFEAFFLYINKEAKLISLAEYDSYRLNDPELIGLEHVWELYLQNSDPSVSSKAGDLLIKIFKFAAKQQENCEVFEALKQNFLETLINHIKIGYLELQNFGSLETNDMRISMVLHSLDLILKLIEESEGYKTSSRQVESLQITIMNQLNNALPPKKFDVSLTPKMTLGQAKSLIAKKLNPPQKPEEIMLFVRGAILSDDNKSLYEHRIENKLTFLVSKQTFQDEEIQQASSEMISPEMLSQKLAYLREMFGVVEEELIKFILEKKKGNENEVAMVLLDERTLEDYREEFQRIEVEKLREKQRCLGFEKEANRPDYFELLFEILSLEIPKLTAKTWTLLNQIPINRDLHLHIKTIFVKHRLTNEKIDWNRVFNPKHPFKTLYSLQIVQAIIACGVLDEKEQLQEINERKEWREKFIEFNGFNHLYKLLFSANPSVMIHPALIQSNNEASNCSLLIRYVSYILEILKVYIHSFLISSVPENQQKFLNQAIKLKENLKEPAPSNDQVIKPVFHPIKFQGTHALGSQSLSNSYSLTPNFHSPNTSKSATPHCTTPPIIDKDGDNVSLNKSSIFDKTKDNNSVLYDEFIGLTKHSIEKLNDKLRSAINFDHLTEKVLHILQESASITTFDPDVLCLIENCFEVLFPSLMAKPELLHLFYSFNGIDEILFRLLTSIPSETIRKTVTFVLNTVCMNFQEPVFKQKLHEINAFKSQRMSLRDENNENLLENFINASFENLENFEENESFGNPNNEDDDCLYEGNSFENKRPPISQSPSVPLEEPRHFFLKLFHPQLLHSSFQNCDSEDFFLSFSGLLKQSSKEEINKIFNLAELFEAVTQKLISREIIEDRHREEEDKVLSGLLLLSKSIVELEPGLKSFKLNNVTPLVVIIHDFLFYGEREGQNLELNMPKCKKKNTRKRGFEFLIELCNKCEENFLTLLPIIVKNHENFQNIDYDSCNCELKPGHGFVGLRNLGCTCYINSLIQQLFMIKDFKNCVLSCEVPEGEADSTLLQLQLLFANMKENIKQYLIPSALIQSLKFDNQPINVHVQQDVNEFFNLLSDKLENQLKPTKYKAMLQEIIGGSLSHEIISLEEEFPYNGEREEPFYSITIEIKHRKNIHEALDYYIKGEILEGENKYFCDQYERKIKVLKRCLIKKLPNTLILTLKRFEFDYNLMQKVKINDFFEFPRTLNMKKWTKEGQEPNGAEEDDRAFVYELVGVLVHAGTAEAGHYYSYIRDRESKLEKWYEFNDTHVSPFNINNLRNECFGGEYDSEEGHVGLHLADWDGSKSKNAYLLFYEKQNCELSEIVKSASQEVPSPLKETILNQNVNYLKSRLFYDLDYFNFIKAFICLYDFPTQTDTHPMISFSESILKELRWKFENQDVISLTKQAQFSSLYGEELNYQLPEAEIQRNLDDINQFSLEYWVKTPALKTIKLAITFAYEIFIKTKDFNGFLGWMHILKPLFENFVPACFWFVNYAIERKEMISELFFEMNLVEAKTAFAKLLIVIINNVFKREDEYLYDRELIEKLEISSDYYSEIKRIEVKKSCLLRFIDMFCLELLPECRKNLSKSLDYLQIVKYLSQLSSKIIYYFVNAKILKNFMDIFMSNAPLNSYYSYQPVVIKMNDKITENHLIPLLDIISLIIRGCLTTGIQRLQLFAPTSIFSEKNYCPMLDPSVVELFIDQSNYLSIFFPMQQFSEATAYITKHLSWGDLKNSQFFLNLLKEILTSNLTSWNQVEQIYRLVDGILKLEDIHQTERIQYFFDECKYYYSTGMTVVDHIFRQKDHERMFSIISIKCIAELGAGSQGCSLYIRENSKKFKWMLEYLNSVPQQTVLNPQTPHLPRVIASASAKLREVLGLAAFEEAQTNKASEEVLGSISENKFENEDEKVNYDH